VALSLPTSGSRLLTGVLLCAVRTFLPPINRGGYHLSCPGITAGILLPTLPDTSEDDSKRAVYLDQQLKEIQLLTNRDIRGITAHKVYPVSVLLQKPVSSYLTFSTSPQPSP
jgi:hypothetical protein